MAPRDSFGSLRPLPGGPAGCMLFSLPALGLALGVPIEQLPISLKVLIENLLVAESRHETAEVPA
jgi:hypothetical protein